MDSCTGVPVNCPRDSEYLRKEFYKHFMLDTCKNCNGLLISFNELNNHIALPEIETSLRERLDIDEKSPFKCPRCDVMTALSKQIDATMHPIVIKNVEIDICANCLSIWFDGGELEKILSREEYAKFQAMKQQSPSDVDEKERQKLVDKGREGGLKAIEAFVTSPVPEKARPRKKVEEKPIAASVPTTVPTTVPIAAADEKEKTPAAEASQPSQVKSDSPKTEPSKVAEQKKTVKKKATKKVN